MSLPEGPVHVPLPLSGGIYAPIPTPFTKDEEVDYPSLTRHALRLAKAGVGLVVSGSTGEAIALTNKERYRCIQVIRQELQGKGLDSIPIIAGTGSGSLRETIVLSHQAKEAGADAVIVIAPGYFSAAIAKDRQALREFFWEAAEASPLPVMVYNFPAASAGIDLDSDLLEEIAKHPNICGAKLTCAGVGKGGRLAQTPGARGNKTFHVFPGYADILFPCMMIGFTGTISGTANLLPRLLVAHYKHIVQFQSGPTKELLDILQKEQDFLSRADWALSKYGVAATKWVIERWYSPMGAPRRPLQTVSLDSQQALERDLREAVEAEQQLERSAALA